jgi:hypothetical protein
MRKKVVLRFRSHFSDLPYENIYSDGSSEWVYPEKKDGPPYIITGICDIIVNVIMWGFIFLFCCTQESTT